MKSHENKESFKNIVDFYLYYKSENKNEELNVQVYVEISCVVFDNMFDKMPSYMD